MSISNVPPINLGTYLTSAQGALYTPILGNVYKLGKKFYRLVQAGASDIPAYSAVVTARSSGVPSWVVSASAVPANPDVAGVVPEDYTSAIPANAYFLLMVGGDTLVLTADTTVVHTSGTEFRLVTASAGSGQVRAVSTFTTASTTDDAGVFAIATNSAVATATGSTIRCFIKGLGF